MQNSLYEMFRKKEKKSENGEEWKNIPEEGELMEYNVADKGNRKNNGHERMNKSERGMDIVPCE